MPTSPHLRRVLPIAGALLAILMLAVGTWLVMRKWHGQDPPRIAVIPRTTGNLHWEAEHVGAEEGAAATGTVVYWNAPTREDDTEAQIRLVDRVIAGNYQGLVLAPDQSLALISPVRRALAHGIPTVVVGSGLNIPGNINLCNILNDDEEGGRLAAQRVGELLKGHGTVAIVGMDADIAGIMTRARSFARALKLEYPEIRIVDKENGSFDLSHERQIAEQLLSANSDVNVIVALTWPSANAVLNVLDSNPGVSHVHLIGFDPEVIVPFEKRSLDSVVIEDTRTMGMRAVQWIGARRSGREVPCTQALRPRIFTRETIRSDEARSMLSLNWQLGQLDWIVSQ